MKCTLLFSLFLIVACSPSAKQEDNNSSAHLQKSNQWLSLEGSQDMPHVVLISGDEEYRSEEALPQLAKILNKHHGFNCTVLFAQDPSQPSMVNGNYSYNIPGLEALETADMMVIFTRFRALPDEQMKYIDDFLLAGKPVLGIRTATHAFHYKDPESQSKYLHYGNYHQSEDAWNGGFGRLVLGEHWISHHGLHGHQSTRGITAPGAEGHPILRGIANGEIWGPTDVYGVRLPLPGDAKPVVLGQVIKRAGELDERDPLLGMSATDTELVTEKELKDGDKITTINPNDPMMPIVWVKSYQLPEGQRGRAIATTIGSSTDMLTEAVRRLLVNAVYWGLEKEVPDRAKVNLVGDYQPSRFAFHDDAYWQSRRLMIEHLAE